MRRPAPPSTAAAAGEDTGGDEHAASGAAEGALDHVGRRAGRPRVAGTSLVVSADVAGAGSGWARGAGGPAATARRRRRQRWRSTGTHVDELGGGPVQGGERRDATSTTCSPAPSANRRRARSPATAASTSTPAMTEPMRIGLSLRAELADRPLLHRRGRQVDDLGADREDRRGGRVQQRGDEVAGGDADEGREDPVEGVERDVIACPLFGTRGARGLAGGRPVG